MTKSKKPERRVLRSLFIDEISAVDRPAQTGARFVLSKRDEDSARKFWGDHMTNPVLTTESDGHQHVVEDCGQGGSTSWAQGSDDEHGHSHPWVRLADGSIEVGASNGHDHGILNTNSTVELAPKAAAYGGSDPSGDPTTMTETDKGGSAEEKRRKDEEKMKEEKAKMTEKRAERAEAIVSLSADERGYFDGLDKVAQDEFLAKSADERIDVVRKSREADRVVYKAANGDEFRASDDPRLVKMARERDEMSKRTEEALAKAERERFEKRAQAELAHCPGTVEVRGAILKALDDVEGAAEFLKAADASLAKSFELKGTTGTGDELAKAGDRLDDLAKAYAADHGVSFQKAYAEVLETSEGARLYAESQA